MSAPGQESLTATGGSDPTTVVPAAVEKGPGRLRRLLHSPMIGPVLTILGASGSMLALSAFLSSGDEFAHMDYGLSVWHGQLPIFENGLAFTPPVSNAPPVQWTAQHPPLFYWLLAPAVGPFIDAEHWRLAVLAGRLISLLTTVFAVVSVIWAARWIQPSRARAWGIAAGAVAVGISPFLRVGGSVYNDNLAAGLSALAIGIVLRALHRGVDRGTVIWAGVVVAAGLLSRGSFVMTALCTSAGLALAWWIHRPERGWRRWGLGLLVGAVPSLFGLAASGWFYLRNIRLTGSWTGGHPDWAAENLDRTSIPLSEVPTRWGFWRGLLSAYVEPANTVTAIESVWLVAVMVILAVAGYSAAVATVWARIGAPEPSVSLVKRAALTRSVQIRMAVVAVMAAQFLGMLVLTAGFVSGGGASNNRYILIALLPVAALLASGIVLTHRYVGLVILTMYLVVAWYFYLSWALVQEHGGSWFTGKTVNSIPSILPLACFALVLVGAVWTVVSFVRRPLPSAGTARR